MKHPAPMLMSSSWRLGKCYSLKGQLFFKAFPDHLSLDPVLLPCVPPVPWMPVRTLFCSCLSVYLCLLVNISSRSRHCLYPGFCSTWTPTIMFTGAKSRLIGKDPDAGKDWGQEEKVATEDEMIGWHHWLNGHEFEQTRRDSEGQRSLACCSSWGYKELVMT